jgi:SAM-dependent methyltransferase
MTTASLQYAEHYRDEMRGRFAALRDDTDLPFTHFSSIVRADPRMGGRVLDIGCGAGTIMMPFRSILLAAKHVDGVEPSDAIVKNTYVKEKWQSTFEDASVPESTYDAAFAFFVLEHVADPRGFCERLARCIRPGGVFYGITPNGRHPFPLLSRFMDVTGLKYGLYGEDDRVNNYPAYYRLNTARQASRAIQGLGFHALDVFYHPAVNWSHYVPKPLRFIPGIYDRLIGTRVASLSQMVMFKLEK